MPLDTETITLSDAHDDLLDAEEQCAERQAAEPIDSDGAVAYAQLGNRAHRFRAGVEWAIAEWGEQTELVLSANTAGERNAAAHLADEHDGWEASDCHVVVGSYEAPYVEHDPDNLDLDELRETLHNVLDLHPNFVDWVEHRIRQLGQLDGETGNSYAELVAAKRQQAQANGNG